MVSSTRLSPTDPPTAVIDAVDDQDVAGTLCHGRVNKRRLP
jgi:hypothetical protein